jgi:DNA-binding transcriptional ArsR family regulator
MQSNPPILNDGCCSLDEALRPGLFRALGDPCRLGILIELATGRRARSVGDIAARWPVDLSVVSRHLGTLRRAGVVEATKHGRQVHYRARCGELAQALRQMATALEACCPTEPQPKESKP